jgi:hypothetical protein
MNAHVLPQDREKVLRFAQDDTGGGRAREIARHARPRVILSRADGEGPSPLHNANRHVRVIPRERAGSPAAGDSAPSSRRVMTRWLLLLLALTTPALRAAVLTTSGITGRVLVANAPAAGVTVTVTSKALQHERTTTTNANGRYWLGALPPGVYDVTFAKTGLVTLTRRTTVELARVARADATLQPGEEGESVTSTAATISVADTHPITTHFSDLALDRLPVRRDPFSVGGLSPAFVGLASVDDGSASEPFLFGEEPFEQVTVLRGALPVEYGRAGVAVVAARTRSGGEDFYLAIRDTITSGIEHHFETASGGHVLPNRLWFFAAGWAGDDAQRFERDARGFDVKLTAQLGASQNLVASSIHGDATTTSQPFSFDRAAGVSTVEYVAVPSAALTFQALVSRSTDRLPFAQSPSPVPSPVTAATVHADTAFAEATYTAGDHLLRGGIDATNALRDSTALFVADRWSVNHFTVDAGARAEHGGGTTHLSPRLFASYDFFGDGRRAVLASYSDSTEAGIPHSTIREATLGFAAALGASGAVRIDALRRDVSGAVVNSLELDTTYRLFDRFEAGANYGYDDSRVSGVSRLAHAWLGAALPIGEQELGVTLLERYGEDPRITSSRDYILATDLAVRYIVPIKSVHLTAAADATNVFASRGPRALRVWLRVRV